MTSQVVSLHVVTVIPFLILTVVVIKKLARCILMNSYTNYEKSISILVNSKRWRPCTHAPFKYKNIIIITLLDQTIYISYVSQQLPVDDRFQ